VSRFCHMRSVAAASSRDPADGAAGEAIPSAIERWCSRFVEQQLELLS